MDKQPVMQSPPVPLSVRYEQSQQAWKRLGMSIGSLTPRLIGRMLLLAGAAAALGWLAIASWPALLPFIAGGVLAYLLFPLVDLLNHLMPRLLAALLAVLLLLGAVGALLWVIVPPLIYQTVLLIHRIPPDTTLRDLSDQLILRLEFLPPNVEVALASAITTATTHLQENLRSGIATFLTPNAILGFVNAIGFILGLIVLPTWLLTVLKDKPRAKLALRSTLPAGMQADIWAVLHIADRAFGTFFRGQVLVAMAVSLATYLGLHFGIRLGVPDTPYLVTFAVLAGVLQLIPEIGPLVNIVLVVLVAYFKINASLALYVLALYLGIQYLVNLLVKDRIEEKIINVHPALLVVVLVALSQLGFFWLFLAAPLAGVTRDLFRYTYGRLSDPPRPAGLLPDEPLPTGDYPSLVPQPRRHVPAIYQRMQTKPSQRRAG